MYRNVLLTGDQISQLKIEVTKILEQNMQSFNSKLAKNTKRRNIQDYDELYQFSQKEYSRFQKILQNLAEFTFTIMSNFDMIWDQVHHRQSKLMELRESFSSATGYMEELKNENEELKDRLNEAETYIQWVEQQKQYLDSIYYQRDNSLLTIYSNEKQMNKCVSERNLQWNENKKKKSINYEKLKVYIDNLKEDRQEMEKELVMLAKKYEIKCEECRRSNLLVQHLAERLNKRSQMKDMKDYFDSMHAQAKEGFRNQLPQEMLRILERTDNTLSISQKKNSLLDEDNAIPNNPNKPFLHYFDSFTHLHESHNRKEEDNLSIIIQKQTKDVKIGTDYFGRKAVSCQTHLEDIQQSREDLRISISILGTESNKQRHDKIVKIIQNLHIEKAIGSKLAPHTEYRKDDSDVKTSDTAKLGGINNTLRSTYQYYRNRLVASRIKKYRFNKPDSHTLPHPKPKH